MTTEADLKRARESFEAACQHEDGQVASACDDCVAESYAAVREECAQIVKWKASTIWVMNLYADGEADQAGREIADAVRSGILGVDPAIRARDFS